MTAQPDARVTIGHLHTTAVLHRKMAGHALSEAQRLQVERQRDQVRLAAIAAGERVP